MLWKARKELLGRVFLGHIHFMLYVDLFSGNEMDKVKESNYN